MLRTPVVFACLSFLWKGGGTQDPAAQDLACLSSRRKDKQPGPEGHGWLGLACLFYLKRIRALGSRVWRLLVFSGGEKTMGPGKTWACLSFLSKKEQQMPGSCLTLGSAGEKRPLACLFYLKGVLQAVLRIGK